MKFIVKELNVFRENILNKAPVSNYQNFKGLPTFSSLVRDLLNQVLHLQNTNDQVFIDTVYVNQSGTLACGFEEVDENSCVRHEFDTSERKSLLKNALSQGYRPGAKLMPAKF